MTFLVLLLIVAGMAGLLPLVVQLIRLRLSLGRHSKGVAIILFDTVLYTLGLIVLIGVSAIGRRLAGLSSTPVEVTLLLTLLFAPFPWVVLWRLRCWKREGDGVDV